MDRLIAPCIQVVGYKNSGKTTLVSKLVKACHQKGIKTATLKHHGHGGKPDEAKNVDSSQHLAAGAIASGVEGGGRLQLSMEDMKIEQILKLYQYLSYDFLIMEGYKQLEFPKVVMIREKEDLSLLHTLTEVRLVIVWKKDLGNDLEFPCFEIDEEESYIDYLLGFAKGGQA